MWLPLWWPSSRVSHPLIAPLVARPLTDCHLSRAPAVDRVGRRPLLLQAGVQMAAAEVVIGTILALGFQSGNLSSSLSLTVIVFICIFISGFAWSWGEWAEEERWSRMPMSGV